MRAAGTLALLGLLAASAPAHAYDEPLSRKHFDRGIALEKLGRHREALAEFELAYQSNPRASILYNLAYIHKVLAEAGSLDEMRKSIEFYQKYLQFQPKAPDRADVLATIADLRARVASTEMNAGTLPVTELPPPPEKAPITDAPRTSEPERAVPIVPAPGKEPAKAGEPDKKPSRKWLWVGLGAAAAVAAGTAVGLGVGLTRGDGRPDSDFFREVNFP